jgi:toxin ParE1/3/4
VQAALDLIASRPESFPTRAENVRRALVRRFPYAVYYRLEDERIVVLAIVHTSRDSAVWQERL